MGKSLSFLQVISLDNLQFLTVLPLTHLYPMHPLSTPFLYPLSLPCRFLIISGGRERLHWEQMLKYVCVRFTPFIIPPMKEARHGRQGLHVKLIKLILQIGCPPYHLTPWKKSALLQKPSVQMVKTFHQHVHAEKTMI